MQSLSLILCTLSLVLSGCIHTTVQDSPIKSDPPPENSIVLDITEISVDHFKAKLPWPYPCEYTVKFALPEDYCVNDRVLVIYDSITEIDKTSTANGLYTCTVKANRVEPSDFQLEPNAAYKPVIYLYPMEETSVSVQLDYKGTLTHTWPLYENGWIVTAKPDGTLTDKTGRSYPYLFWEGESDTVYDTSRGFCVEGKDSKAFLQNTLTKLGLNETEAAEFMDFWLPHLEANLFNRICFQGAIYDESAPLTITPKPDTLIRVFMVFTPLQAPIELPPQTLDAPARHGFTVVEWGGAFQP